MQFIRAADFLQTETGRRQIIPLQDLQMTYRDAREWNYQALQQADILNVYELTLLTEAELSRIPNFDAGDVRQTYIVLSRLGLTLAADSTPLYMGKRQAIQRQEIDRAYITLRTGGKLSQLLPNDSITQQALSEKPQMVAELLTLIDAATEVLGQTAVHNIAADPKRARALMAAHLAAQLAANPEATNT